MTAFALSAEKPKPEELLQAVQLHDMVAINRLLAQGADVNAPNDAGATPLMQAVPDLDLVRLLVASGANVNARSTSMGRTPFLIASSYPGTVPLLRYLASKGADTKVTNRFGGGAVVRAVRSSDVEVLRCLLDLGLEPSAGSTPGAVLALAARRQYRPSLDLLMSRMSPPRKIFPV